MYLYSENIHLCILMSNLNALLLQEAFSSRSSWFSIQTSPTFYLEDGSVPKVITSSDWPFSHQYNRVFLCQKATESLHTFLLPFILGGFNQVKIKILYSTNPISSLKQCIFSHLPWYQVDCPCDLLHTF